MKGEIYVAIDPAQNLEPQAKQIVEIVRGAPEGRISRDELLARIKEKIKTTMPPERLLSYYKSKLLSKKFVKVEQAPAEAEKAAA